MPTIECFPYLGPNRRSDNTVVEITVNFAPEEAVDSSQNADQIKSLLLTAGVLTEAESFPQQELPNDLQLRYMSLLVQTALLFQQKVGHRVNDFSVSHTSQANRCIALLEYEHCDVGMTAVKLAYELVSGQRKLLAEPFRMFKQFALERLLPLDSEAIIKAANRRDIPCIHLERQPFWRKKFEHITAGDCIRANGLMMLGHGTHQHILDGTFCLDKSADIKDLINDKMQRMALLNQLALPVAREGEPQEGERREGQHDPLNAGKYWFVAINGQITAAIDQTSGKSLSLSDFHDSVPGYVLAINHAIDLAPVLVSMLLTDIASPLPVGAGVIDFDVAPRLDQYMAGLSRATGSGTSCDTSCGGEPLLDRSAEALVEWLFPLNSKSRMPTIAITGTNGKTTTTRMVSHILSFAGRKPGMVCTDGIYFNGQKIKDGDSCTVIGHLDVLTSTAVDVAVLETHHNGILKRGFAFETCDIAICLNVSEDHLGTGNIDTVEQMAEIKQALPERARKAAILNADNSYCLAMFDSMVAENICMVSMQRSVEELRAMLDENATCFCVVEAVDSQEWLVLYDRGQRLTVLHVNSIPATFEGTARFNISNAMHAVVAAYYFGIPIETIRQALSSFTCSYESTPGRLNVFDKLPFRIIMDFAHNAEGIAVLCDFIDRQQVTGRKILAFAGMSIRTDEAIKNIGRSAAGHFDFYYCKEHATIEKGERKVARILRQGLLDSGVTEDQTKILGYGRDVIFEIFDSCKPGDLLVVLSGHVEKNHLGAYIEEYSAKPGKTRSVVN